MSNRRKKILFVLGTRPEAIKMASVIEKFKKKKKFNIRLCVTAQHREMLDQVLNIFRLKADYDLNVMSQNQDLFDITGKILSKLKTVINDYRPDYIFVHGDTTTAMVGALAGFYTNTLVCHVEAGLRTYDLQSPYPEEFNRQLVGKLSKFHFTPTIKSKNNLLNELIDKKKILVSGNTVIDSLLIALEKIDKSKKISKEIFSYFDEIFSFNLKKEKFILITGHRRENFGEDFKKIFTSLKRLAKKNADVRFIYPVHLNPNVRFQVYDILGNLKNFHLIDPLPYLHFITLMKYSYFIITDSGGIQEEAPSLGKPVLVTRKVTERPEAVEAGTVILVGSNQKLMEITADELLRSEKKYHSMSKKHNPYGDGLASERIHNFMTRINE